MIQRISNEIKKIFTPVVLFFLILMLGVFIRVWKFDRVPPGLHQDEASIGLEAYDLLHFGVDRNGNSFPVNFTSWGDGMDALYGYVLIPFMTMGLTPFTTRLPVLLSALLTLPLVYYIAKKTLGQTFALLAMLLLAISPWHILMSRWGINENILPFVFVAGYLCLLRSTTKNYWFIISAVFFALCIYAYGAMYLAIPVFLICAIPILIWSKRLSVPVLLAGLVIFLVLVLPIFLFILVNAFGWDSIHLGVFTVPRLPVPARFLYVSAISQSNPIFTVAKNIWAMVRLLFIVQSDGNVFNNLDPYGYLYAFSIPLAVVGAFLLVPTRKEKPSPEKLLVLIWLLAGGAIGLAQPVNTNRIALIFIPIILCTAVCLEWLGKQKKIVLVILVGIYLFSFISFTKDYFAKPYLEKADSAFYAGLVPALDFANLAGSQPICVTNRVNSPYIFALFTAKLNPTDYFSSIRYIHPELKSGPVVSVGRYTFGIANCANNPATIYVLSSEQPPDNGIKYSVKNFTLYHVYSPQP